jgi:hypothetical protein
MTIFLLSVLPLLSIFGVFVYAAVTGIRMFRSSGKVAVLGVAIAVAGLTVGRLVDRLGVLPRSMDDWINYRGGESSQVSTGAERFLVVMSVEVALLFVFAAVIAFLAITLIRRDAEPRAAPEAGPTALVLLSGLFVFAVAIAARTKLAVFLAYLLAKGHLI